MLHTSNNGLRQIQPYPEYNATYVLQGWSQTDLGDDFNSFFARKRELSALNGCILWESCAAVPPQGQPQVIEELHDAHTGACKSKMLARSYVHLVVKDRYGH